MKLGPVIELAEELGGHGALGETCREPAKSLERRLERRRNSKESSIPNDLVALGALFWQFFNSLVYRSSILLPHLDSDSNRTIYQAQSRIYFTTMKYDFKLF